MAKSEYIYAEAYLEVISQTLTTINTCQSQVIPLASYIKQMVNCILIWFEFR